MQKSLTRKKTLIFISILVSIGLLFVGITSYISKNREPEGQNEHLIGEILFSRSDNSIWIMNSNGSDQTCITGPTTLDTEVFKGNATYTNPSFSPDGNRIAFISNKDSGSIIDKSLYTMDKNGENVQKIEDGLELSYYHWSPDGMKIVYTLRNNINIIDIETKERELILNIDDDCMSPKWSPDGESIIFSIMSYSDIRIGIINIFDKNLEVISPIDSHDVAPVWSSIGNKIIYRSFFNNSWNLCSMDVSGNNRKVITTGMANGYDFSINSNGMLVYIENNELYIQDIHGNNKSKLLDSDTPISMPRWSPNGKYIVYLEGWLGYPAHIIEDFHLAEIYKIDVDTKDTLRLTNNDVMEKYPSWKPIV